MARIPTQLISVPLALLVTLSVFSGQSFAEIFHISSQGDDANSGIGGQAWGSFEHAFTVLSPGDTLILEDGLYTESIIPSSSGEADNPISIIAEHDGLAIVEAIDEPAINVNNKNYLTIEGITACTSGETSTVYIGGHDGPDWSDKTTSP